MGSMTWDRSVWLDFNFCISQVGESRSTHLRVTKKIKIHPGMASWSSAWAPVLARVVFVLTFFFGNWRLRIEFALERKDKWDFFFLKKTKLEVKLLL